MAFVAYLCRTGASSLPHVNFPLTTVTANSVEQQNDTSEKKVQVIQELARQESLGEKESSELKLKHVI